MAATEVPTAQARSCGWVWGLGLLVRFGLVGTATTLLDLTLYNVLSGPWCALPLVPAHLLASVVTVTVSFFGQRNLVFHGQGGRISNQAVRFILVTVTGVSLVQSVVLAGTAGTLATLHAHSSWLALVPAERWPLVLRNLAKAAAMIVGITWNFFWFRHWVFRSPGTRGVEN